MRTTIVSTQHLNSYRVAIYSVIGLSLAIVLGFIVASFYKSIYYPIPALFMMAYIILSRIKLLRKLKNITYDNSNIYYNVNDYEEQIPFYQIKEVQLYSVNGVYKINLRTPGQAGKEIFFKPSVWYPFNFNKQDVKVDQLRKAIRQYRQTLPAQPSGIPLTGINL